MNYNIDKWKISIFSTRENGNGAAENVSETIKIKFVPPDMTNAHYAQAWSFHLTLEEYKSILVEA